jgi:nitrogen regulatory protein P-II 1
MKKIEAILASFKLDEVRHALIQCGIPGFSVAQVSTLNPHTHAGWYRGTEYVVWYAPQIKIEVVVPDHQVARCVEVFRRSARVGDRDPTQIVVLPVEDAVRIWTGERLGEDRPRATPLPPLRLASRAHGAL